MLYICQRAGRSAGRSLPWHGRGLGFKSRPVHYQTFIKKFEQKRQPLVGLIGPESPISPSESWTQG